MGEPDTALELTSTRKGECYTAKAYETETGPGSWETSRQKLEVRSPFRSPTLSVPSVREDKYDSGERFPARRNSYTGGIVAARDFRAICS
jgi:hypothetical protein